MTLICFFFTSSFRIYIANNMPAFRWNDTAHDIALAKEVIACRPSKPLDWDYITTRLNAVFATKEKPVVKGRGCRERLDRLLEGLHLPASTYDDFRIDRIMFHANANLNAPFFQLLRTSNGLQQTATRCATKRNSHHYRGAYAGGR